MEYLGDGYAKEIIQFIRTQNFSNYLSNETNCLDYDEQGLVKKKKEMKMPIYNFRECISKIKKYILSLSSKISIPVFSFICFIKERLKLILLTGLVTFISNHRK